MAGLRGQQPVGSQPSLSEELEDESFSCSICLLPFNECERLPKRLECHHTFCRQCLYQLHAEDPKTLKCPVCSEESRLGEEGVDSLHSSYYLCKLTEVSKTLKLREEVENLSSFLKDANIAADTCSKHGNTEKFFWCNTCSVKVCIHCLGVDHSLLRNHDVEDLKQAASYLRKAVIDRIEEIKRKSSNIEHIKSKVHSTSSNMLEMSNVLKYTFQAPSKNCKKTLRGKEDINKNLTALTEYCASESLPHNPHGLLAMKNQIEELLRYYVTIDEFFEQKYKEFRMLEDSKIMLSVIKPDVKFNHGKIHCIGCGELCTVRHPVETGKENLCSSKSLNNYCKTCGIVIMEFS